jgi:hypothetical protein
MCLKNLASLCGETGRCWLELSRTLSFSQGRKLALCEDDSGNYVQ